MKPVNLNQFKKQKARADKKTRADENAVKFGRSKAQRLKDDATVTKHRKHIDAHKRDPKDL